jgi:hypothetical protein
MLAAVTAPVIVAVAVRSQDDTTLAAVTTLAVMLPATMAPLTDTGEFKAPVTYRLLAVRVPATLSESMIALVTVSSEHVMVPTAIAWLSAMSVPAVERAPIVRPLVICAALHVSAPEVDNDVAVSAVTTKPPVAVLAPEDSVPTVSAVALRPTVVESTPEVVTKEPNCAFVTTTVAAVIVPLEDILAAVASPTTDAAATASAPLVVNALDTTGPAAATVAARRDVVSSDPSRRPPAVVSTSAVMSPLARTLPV